MRIAIIYSTKYGATEKIANCIGNELSKANEVLFFNLKKDSIPTLKNFDVVLLGSSIYMSKITPKMDSFCKDRYSELCDCKNLHLFLCGMDEYDAEKFKAELYPESVRTNAKSIKWFPGEYHLKRMNLFDRLLLRICFKIKDDVIRDYEGLTRNFLEGV